MNFLHGANIFMLDEFENEEKNEKYKAAFKDVFNEATLPFYWSDLEPVEGQASFCKGQSENLPPSRTRFMPGILRKIRHNTESTLSYIF